MKPPPTDASAAAPGGGAAARPRDDILGQRLRANLARRKAQARARAEREPDPPHAGEPAHPDAST